MNLKDKIKKVIKNPLWFIIFLNNRGFYLLGDKKYLRLLYKLEMNSNLDLENPITFNEKLQWLKLYDRNSKYTKMVDKYDVKEYIENAIGKEYIIPTLGVYNSFNEIDWEKLPKQFVIKCTHDSGGLVICKDKNSLDIKSSERLINKCLKNKFYYSGREWPYKNVKPRIIIEKYMATEEQPELIDYKFFCFNGRPELLYVSEGLSDHSTAKISFADMEYKLLEFYRKDFKPFKELPHKPENFEKMKELARKLSKDIPFVRVDFYEIEGKIYFGELTFYPGSGYIPFEPEEYDKVLGDMLELPKEKLEEKNEK